MPSILIVHLKRFEFNPKRKGKIRDFVDFPLKNLDLTPYVSRLQRDKPVYDLFAVVNHEGYLGGGHYYAFTKHRQNHQWYYFNDEMVNSLKREDSIVTADAYILFYSKMSVDEFCRQTLTEPGLWPHMITSASAAGEISSHQTLNTMPSQSIRKQKKINDREEDFIKKAVTSIQIPKVSEISSTELEDTPVRGFTKAQFGPSVTLDYNYYQSEPKFKEGTNSAMGIKGS